MPTQADWSYYTKFFDSSIKVEESTSPAETDACHAYRRLLTDPDFRHHMVELIGIGPGGQSIQVEIEAAYARETPKAA